MQQYLSLMTVIDPPALGKPDPVYAHITTVPLSDTVNFITVAGQAAIRADGSTPETLPVRMKLCLENISLCLEAVKDRYDPVHVLRHGEGVGDTETSRARLRNCQTMA